MRCYYCRAPLLRDQTTCTVCTREQPAYRPIGVALWVGGAALMTFAGTVGEPGRLHSFDPAAQPILESAAMVSAWVALALSVVVFVRMLWLSGSLRQAVLHLLGYLLALQAVGFMAAAPNGVDFPS
jgi:hypothetical protein